jgi:HK97 family phage portal protein
MPSRRHARAAARAAAKAADPTDPPTDPLTALIADAVARRMAGGTLTPFELPVVAACRQMIAGTVAQLPIVAMVDRRPKATQPAIYKRPDPFEPRGRTLERICWNLTGPGWCWLVESAARYDGYPSAIRVLDADQASPTGWDTYGRMTEVTDIAGIVHTPGDSIHWVPASVEKAWTTGQGPLGACWRAVEYLCALYDMAGSFYEAGFPSVAISVPQRLTKKQADDLKARVVSSWARRHEPAVIDMDGDLKPVGSNAVEAQLVESIRLANAEIARTFGIPPVMANVEAANSLHYTSTALEFEHWQAVGLGNYLWRIEAAFTDLQPYGTTARLDTSELTRSDFNARCQSYAIALGQQAWLEPDEVRDREGYDPMAEPMDEAGALPQVLPVATAV